MFTTIWRFTVHPDRVAEFEQHYRADGAWAQLFRRSAAYVRTDLLRDVDRPDRYVTMDVWQDEVSYRVFRAQHADEYAALDAQCEEWTSGEEHVGNIESPSAS